MTLALKLSMAADFVDILMPMFFRFQVQKSPKLGMKCLAATRSAPFGLNVYL